jgi:hypothetical protein
MMLSAVNCWLVPPNTVNVADPVTTVPPAEFA